MTARGTDERLSRLAGRLRLTLLRDHLPEILEAITAARMTPRDALEYAFSKEVEQREANHFRQALRAAHFPMIRKLEDFDFSAQPSIDPGVIRELARLEWIGRGENVGFFGVPGVGKTHLALALGHKALEEGFSVRFYNASVLLSGLEKASRDGTLETRLREINKHQVLIIDEVGYLPFTPSAGHLFFQLVCRRYEKKSIVVTTNRPPSEWHLTFPDKAVCSTIVDHLLHHCTAITIRGESYRLREHKREAVRKGLVPRPPAPEDVQGI